MLPLLNCKKLFNQNFSTSKERNLVREKEWDEELGEAAAGLLTTATGLLADAGNAIKWGVEKTKLGVVYTANGIKEFVDWARDPGEPNLNLPIYKKMTRSFNAKTVPDGGLTGDLRLDTALKYHSRLQFLNFQTSMYVELTRPAMEEYKAVDDRIGLIQAQKFNLDSQIADYDDKIAAIDKTLRDGLFREGTVPEIQIKTRRQELVSQKLVLEQMTSFRVKWRKPEIQTVEFPPKSGKTFERFVPSDTEETDVDLRQLKEYLKGFTLGYKSELAIYSYEYEKKRLAYHRDKLYKEFLEESEKIVWDFNSDKKRKKYLSTIAALDKSASTITGKINFPIKGPQERKDLVDIKGDLTKIKGYTSPSDITAGFIAIRDKAIVGLRYPDLHADVMKSLEKIRDEANKFLAVTGSSSYTPYWDAIDNEVSKALSHPSLGVKDVKLGYEDKMDDLFIKSSGDLNDLRNQFK